MTDTSAPAQIGLPNDIGGRSGRAHPSRFEHPVGSPGEKALPRARRRPRLSNKIINTEEKRPAAVESLGEVRHKGKLNVLREVDRRLPLIFCFQKAILEPNLN